MGRGTVVRPSRVRPMRCSDVYTSYMLLDHTNSDAKNLMITKGVVKAGGSLLPCARHGEPGDEKNNETYVILTGHCRFAMDGVWYDLEAGDIVFIPAGVDHGLDNSQSDEDLEILAIWEGAPQKGINETYDRRLKEWGKSFMLAEECREP